MSEERSLTLSETAKKLAEIAVEPVERKFVTKEIGITGKIDYDETMLKYIAARFAGRLERLYVDYTGITVKKGEHLVDIYSPDLITAQEELLQSLRLMKGTTGTLQKTAKETIESAKEKLELWGLSLEQIKDIERRGKTLNRLTIYSPISGVVVEKNAIEGMYVKTGTNIYTIAGLSRLWLKLDAYESDLIWLHYGQKVEFEVEAYPGELFYGRISFIDPVLNEKTRTVKLRVNVDNSDGRLKPGMFTRAIIRSKLDSRGKILDTELSGKWISPMHPEIIKEMPGKCDICGMPLVRAEDLGFVKSDIDAEPPLVIKVSAPLITGKRAVVYIQDPYKEQPTYNGREIMLGPRAGDYYIVRSGLEEGELVVVNGNFKIDSALQIMAKPSMMNPEGGAMSGGHQHH
jgi:Cu(I)/Ag(I) efflux system membrane fusion protein